MAQVYLNENGTDPYQLEDGSGVLLLEQEDPTVHRQPFFTTFVKAVTLVAAIISQPVPNLLASTLAITAPPAEAPFYQLDWPNPSSKAENLEAHGYANRLPPEEEVVLPPTDATLRAPYFVQEVKGLDQLPAILSQPYSNTAIQQQAPLQPDPFRSIDWPNPVERQESEGVDPIPNVTVNLAIPFASTDWQNPASKYEFVDALAPPNILTTTLSPVVEAAAPFRQTDWPNPSTKAQEIEAHGYNINRVLPEEPAEDIHRLSPYFAEQFEKPQQLEAILSQPVSNLAINLTPAAAAPFAPFDWQNPALTAPERIEAILSQPVSNIVIRTPSAFSVPFSMVDWPNPVITVPLDISNLGMTGSTHLSFIPPPPEPPEITELRKIITLIEDRIDTILG